MQKYYHFYEKSYENFTPDWFDESNIQKIEMFLKENTESLKKFIESYERQFDWADDFLTGKEILVTGCGFGGLCHYLESRGAIVTGVDVSKLAISGAQEIKKLLGKHSTFKCLDMTEVNKLGSYDFIFDDHLFHCLATKPDRLNYLRQLKSMLIPDGLIFIESMAFHSGLQVPVEYNFDDESILWKNDTMVRKIADSIEIENEVKESGLFINYLYFHSELSFQAFPEYKDYPSHFEPKTIRLTCKAENPY
jgi:2-polyprenyl-3-methyl-5-hydroxy-6-metoxy-1,4-benzoquinol methylase